MKMKIPRVHHAPVKSRFPTKFNPVRSAYKQKIYLPAGVSYNPPPSAPDAMETPAAFLPAEELKLRSYLKDDKDYPVDKMPRLSAGPLRTYHLTPETVKEIQELRTSDPYKWTRSRLAEKFGVSGFVIGMVSSAPAEHQAEMASRLDQIHGMWTDKRARARNHRERRTKFWLRDD